MTLVNKDILHKLRLRELASAEQVVDEAWFAEVEKRKTEIETGAVSLLPGPETLAKLRAVFR